MRYDYPAVPPVRPARRHPDLRGARGLARGPDGVHLLRRPAGRGQATTSPSSPSASASRSTSWASVPGASSSSRCRDAPRLRGGLRRPRARARPRALAQRGRLGRTRVPRPCEDREDHARGPSAPRGRCADLYVVGPEQPLVDGLADELRAPGRPVVGPGVDGARLEGSKAFMKDVLVAAGVPTARHGSFAEPGRGDRVPRRARRHRGREDRRPRRGQGRARHRRPRRRRGRRDRQALRRRVRGRRSSRRDRGGARGQRVLAARPRRRVERGAASRSRGTTSASATATPVRTPGGMGAVSPRRCRRRRAGRRRSWPRAIAPDARRARPARHRVPRRALRRDHGRPRGAEGARVQRAARRPRGRGRAPATRRRPFDLFFATATGTLTGARGSWTTRRSPWCSPHPATRARPRPGRRSTGWPTTGSWPSRRDGVVVFHGATRRADEGFVVVGRPGARRHRARADDRRGAGPRLRGRRPRSSSTGCQVRHDIAAGLEVPA